jgi:hypothetical protein
LEGKEYKEPSFLAEKANILIDRYFIRVIATNSSEQLSTPNSRRNSTEQVSRRQLASTETEETADIAFGYDVYLLLLYKLKNYPHLSLERSTIFN